MRTRRAAQCRSGRESCTLHAYMSLRVRNSTIRVEAIFSSYRIQSNSNNEISLLLSADALSQVLRPLTLPGVSLEDVTMKLAKKNDVPVLNFEIATASRGGRTVRVSHDVRIDIMKPQDVAELKEPLCPEPDVSGPR